MNSRIKEGGTSPVELKLSLENSGSDEADDLLSYSKSERAELAWELREHLRAIITDTLVEDWNETDAYLFDVLEAVSDHQIHPGRFNHKLLEVAFQATKGNPMYEAGSAALKLRAMSKEELEAHFASLKVKTSQTATLTKAPNIEFGGRIASHLMINHEALAEKLENFLGDLYLNPYALGHLALKLGVSEPGEFVDAVAKLSNDEMVDLKTEASAAMDSWFHGEQLWAQKNSEVPAYFAQLLEGSASPQDVPELVAQAEHAHMRLGPELLKRQAHVLNVISAQLSELSHEFGAKWVEIAAAPLVDGKPLADLVSAAPTVYTEDTSPQFLNNKLKDWEQNLRHQLRAVWAQRLIAEVKQSPATELEDLKKLIDEVGQDDPGLIIAFTHLLRHMEVNIAADNPDETDGAVFQWLLSEGLQTCMAWMLELMGSKSPTLVSDLRAVALERSKTYDEVTASTRANHDRDLALAADKLLVPSATIESVERHAKRWYPHEALGYLLAAGPSVAFFPLGNDYIKSGESTTKGLANPDDCRRLIEWSYRLGYTPLADVHSHPDTSPLFSPEDIVHYAGSTPWFPKLRGLIVGVRADQDFVTHTQLASWSFDSSGRLRGEDTIERL